MDNIEEEELLKLEDDIVISWIDSAFKEVVGERNILKRVRHVYKHDYWESNWGRLISSVEINDPNSYNARIFKRRFVS